MATLVHQCFQIEEITGGNHGTTGKGVATYGYDALNNQFVDMIEAGILDPTKVTRSALQNAASVAATMLTTESVVVDLPEPPAPAMPGADMY